MSRRSEFDAITRALQLAEVSLPEGGRIRPGTLVARSGAAARGAETLESRQRTKRAGAEDARSLPRLEIAHDEVPPRLGDAELTLGAVLGAGGMGVVHQAQQRSLRREVAVKQLREGVQRTEGVGALLTEARITGALEHPSIVPVHALGVDATGAPLLVMKKVSGATLEELLSEDHPEWPALVARHGDRVAVFCDALMKVAEALHFAHARGVFHRDIKPANVMVGSFGEVYLLDWGVALRASEAAEAAVEIVGTPQYMAPEMVRAEATAIDARTDVYLLGATLHALLTGKPRHAGEGLALLLYAAFESAPVHYDDDVPDELGQLANACTSAEPDARPPSAQAFRDALAAFLRHRGAARMAQDAEASLHAMRGPDGSDPSPAQLATPDTAAELDRCRFALGRAIEEWDHARARAALRVALTWSIESELFRKSPDGAATFLRELDPAPPELASRIEALREALRADERHAALGRIEEAERDTRSGARYRVPVIVGTTVLATLLFVAAILDEAFRAAPVDMQRVVVGDTVMLIIMGGPMFAFRRSLFANRAGRQLSALFVLSLLAATVGDQVFAWRGETSEEGGPLSAMLMGAVFLGAAIGMGGRLWWAAFFSFAFGIVAALWPPLSTSMVGLTCLVCLGVLAADALSPKAR